MIAKVKQYVNNVTKEMKKVTWPTKEQLKESTVVVFVTTFIFTVLIYIMDWIFGRVINFLF